MNLDNTFAVLKPDLSVEPVVVSPTIYADLDANFDHFKSHVLVSTHEFDSDWGMWEKHPAGDEIVMLLSGSAQMVLETDSGSEVVKLDTPNTYTIIPRNTWHTARVSAPTRMLFITPGDGTEHRPLRPGTE
ncbi:MAG: hypothetical protein DHS20C01_07960 [marine bacterium B5-7]|nr:MAG: hypothetical protein DHS20C01_07960 [marine bacterium B5-7]